MLIEDRLHPIYDEIQSDQGRSEHTARKIHRSNRWSEGLRNSSCVTNPISDPASVAATDELCESAQA
jgi:hypothetical protein